MTTKTTRFILGATLGTLLATFQSYTAASTNVISVNFQGRINTDPTIPATDPLGANEVAGVVAAANWNNIDNAYDGDNGIAIWNGPNDGTTGPLMDQNGNPTPVTLTFLANDSWFNDVPSVSVASANARMMNGIIKSQGPGNSSRFTFNNLTNAQYDLYVYFNMNGDYVRADITDGNFTKTFYVVEQHGFTDASSFVECTNTNPAGPYNTGNYVRFDNLATYGGSSLSVSVTYISGADGNGVAGLQLIQDGPAVTNPPPPAIVRQPVSRIAEQGTHVDFTVVATNAGFPLTYQWLSNGSNIAGATNKTYFIENVQLTNAASYQVIVTGNSTNRVSDPAHLAVYRLMGTNSVSGTLSAPIGWFAGPSYTCDGGSFPKGFCPTNTGVDIQPALFYGPTIPIAQQKGPFLNTTAMHKLDIDTFSSLNGNADTGLRLRNNWSPFLNACCDDNTPGGTDPNQSQCPSIVLGTTGAFPVNTYKLIVMYKNTPTPPAQIYFNWLYHE